MDFSKYFDPDKAISEVIVPADGEPCTAHCKGLAFGWGPLKKFCSSSPGAAPGNSYTLDCTGCKKEVEEEDGPEELDEKDEKKGKKNKKDKKDKKDKKAKKDKKKKKRKKDKKEKKKRKKA